jgi:hypothetical protein
MEEPVWLWLRQGALWALLGGVVFAITRRLRAARLLKRRFARARRGEVEAVSVLARAGFRVQEAQTSRTLTVEVDGKRLGYVVRADFLVRDWLGRRYVAEVKTGERAPDPLHAPTRRQLLEYQVGYPEARAVLLVDMEACSVQRIRFPV